MKPAVMIGIGLDPTSKEARIPLYVRLYPVFACGLVLPG
jgi:hypothetical protein